MFRPTVQRLHYSREFLKSNIRTVYSQFTALESLCTEPIHPAILTAGASLNRFSQSLAEAQLFVLQLPPQSQAAARKALLELAKHEKTAFQNSHHLLLDPDRVEAHSDLDIAAYVANITDKLPSYIMKLQLVNSLPLLVDQKTAALILSNQSSLASSQLSLLAAVCHLSPKKLT